MLSHTSLAHTLQVSESLSPLTKLKKESWGHQAIAIARHSVMARSNRRIFVCRKTRKRHWNQKQSWQSIAIAPAILEPGITTSSAEESPAIAQGGGERNNRYVAFACCKSTCVTLCPNQDKIASSGRPLLVAEKSTYPPFCSPPIKVSRSVGKRRSNK